MEIFTKHELLLRKKEIIKRIKDGQIFIYPTDTIYGIGCDATNEDAVNKVREIKRRQTSPFSIWIPSKKWFEENCVYNENQKMILNEKLPGPVTFIVKLNNPSIIAKNVNPKDDTIGIRLSNHYLAEIFEEFGRPIVTTSANKKGEQFMTDIDNLDPDIKDQVEFMIYDGKKEAKPSRLINLVTDEVMDR
jgi:L-threonylcarbamoyladenylate synthase